MRKIVSIILLTTILINVTSFLGCKKGEDDPFFSFRTRKARMVADWDITKYDSKITTSFNNGEQIIEDFSINGKKVKEIIDSVHTVHDTSITTTGEVNEAYYKFDKNGSVEFVFNYTLVKDSSGTDENTDETTQSIRTRIYKTRALGTWNFLAGVDDYKNKERISLVWETYNTSLSTSLLRVKTDDEGKEIYRTNTAGIISTENKYANGERAEVWEINQLKNKETVIYQDVNYLIVSKDSIGGAGRTLNKRGNRLMTLSQGETQAKK